MRDKPSRWAWLYGGLGLAILAIGMVVEFLAGMVVPRPLMQLAYQNGFFLLLFILLFGVGVHLLRRGLLGFWRSRLDSAAYAIGATLFAAFTAETVLNLQAGHPYTYLAQTDPLLMILLWAFIFPPINPISTTLLSIGLAIAAALNLLYPPSLPTGPTSSPSGVSPKVGAPWWLVVGQLTRINVWLGSIFLFALSFLLLGGPPLSQPPFPLCDLGVWLHFATALASASLLNSFIFVQNQLGDLDTDRLHPEKSRLPLAAGRISRRTGTILALVFLVLAVVLALATSLLFLGVLGGIVVLGCFYSGPPLRLKAKPIVDLAMIGLAFGVMAVVAAYVVLALQPQLPLPLLVGAGLFYAGTHGVHTASDYEADKLAGLRTTAVLLGPRWAVRLGLLLSALGLALLYSAVGYYTHLFWYGLLKFKTVLLFTFTGLILFSLIDVYRQGSSLPGQAANTSDQSHIDRLGREGRSASYCLFLILTIYCLLYLFLFYPTYYPSYEFPWL